MWLSDDFKYVKEKRQLSSLFLFFPPCLVIYLYLMHRFRAHRIIIHYGRAGLSSSIYLRTGTRRSLPAESRYKVGEGFQFAGLFLRSSRDRRDPGNSAREKHVLPGTVMFSRSLCPTGLSRLVARFV